MTFYRVSLLQQIPLTTTKGELVICGGELSSVTVQMIKKTIMSPLLKQYTEVMKLPFNLSFWLISISPDIRQRGCFFFLLFFCKSVRVHGFVTFVIILQFGSCQLSQLFTIDCKTCCVQIRRLQCVLRPVWEER